MNASVCVVRTEARYPDFPFDQPGDPVEAGLRDLFKLWGRDPEDPFVGWAPPGGKVLLKPNWVLNYNSLGHSLDSLVTHTSILFHLADRAAKAMDGKGEVVIADAPLQGCNFDDLMAQARIPEMIGELEARYPRLRVTVEDWRLTVMSREGEDGRRWASDVPQAQRIDYAEAKERGFRIVDLGQASFLEDIVEFSDRFRVTQYKPSRMRDHHAPGKHEYLVSKRVFWPDLLINVPKMKTHIKAGLTGALKNLVGINGHKEYLPHHISGSYDSGGDCYNRGNRIRTLYDGLYDNFWENYSALPKLKRIAMHATLGSLWRLSNLLTKDEINAGSWSQNETIWRTTLDLNHILYFSEGSAPHIISVVDGIIAGEGEGPLTPLPKSTGILVGGENPAYVDAVLAQLMGYNISRIPTVYQALYHRKSSFGGPFLEDYQVACLGGDGEAMRVPIRDLPNLAFEKPQHWARAGNPARESFAGVV